MQTEEQAKTKWCPMVTPGPQDTATEKHYMHPSQCCVGSACMMWRWEMSQPGMSTPIGVAFKPEKTGRGYCGLAGQERDTDG